MRKLLLTFLLSIPLALFAQRGDLGNEGLLYVSPETVLTAESHFVNQPTGEYTNDGEVVLRRNFHNDGLTDFTPGLNGYTYFQGLQVQEISGTIGADFYNVLFDNQSTAYSFLLSGEIYVFGQADFYRGIVDNYNYSGSLIFERNATAISASDRSYVEGVVEKLGVSSFTFPIGKEEMYRPGGFILLEDNPTHYTAEYQAFNSNSEFAHEQRVVDIIDIDDKEYWTIEDVTSDEATLISLTWDDRITPARLLDYQGENDGLAVVAWDETASQWISLGGVSDMQNNTVTSIFEGQNFKTFTLGKIRVIPKNDDFLIYNGINPNDEGGNDYFKIIGLENFPDNRVRVYNRWGVLVFDESRYDTSNNVFRGISDGRANIKRGEELPVGTYFYILDYVVPETSKSKSIQGYLYLNR